MHETEIIALAYRTGCRARDPFSMKPPYRRRYAGFTHENYRAAN
jgi:hypothetical protein